MKQWKWKHVNRKGRWGTRRFVKRQGVVNAERMGSAKRQAVKAVREQDITRKWTDRWYPDERRSVHES